MSVGSHSFSPGGPNGIIRSQSFAGFSGLQERRSRQVAAPKPGFQLVNRGWEALLGSVVVIPLLSIAKDASVIDLTVVKFKLSKQKTALALPKVISLTYHVF